MAMINRKDGYPNAIMYTPIKIKSIYTITYLNNKHM